MQQATISFVVPASAAYFLLEPCFVDGQVTDAIRRPVVAFAIDSEGDTHPVTLDGIEDHGDLAILTPAGEVHSYCDTWESFNEWLAEQMVVRSDPPIAFASPAGLDPARL